VFDTAQLYSTGAQATATPVPPDTTPPGNVAQFTAVPEGCLELYLSWQNPGDADFAGVVVVRKADGYPETPADGVVVYTGSAENHADTLQLGESMTYNYTAFAFDSAQNYSSGAQASGTTADCTPPENVSSFLAVPGDGLITLSWQNPGDPDFAGVRVVRKAESYPTSMDDGVKVYDDIGERFVDQPLENTIPYFYVAYAYDGVPLFASGVQATATPHEMTPPPDILRFAASPGLGQISLSWVKPSSSDFAGVRIQRSTKGYPTSVDDGDTVFESSENPPFVDTGLTGGVPYYYKAFSYDAWQNYSAGVTATATPTRIIIGR